MFALVIALGTIILAGWIEFILYPSAVFMRAFTKITYRCFGKKRPGRDECPEYWYKRIENPVVFAVFFACKAMGIAFAAVFIAVIAIVGFQRFANPSIAMNMNDAALAIQPVIIAIVILWAIADTVRACN